MYNDNIYLDFYFLKIFSHRFLIIYKQTIQHILIYLLFDFVY